MKLTACIATVAVCLMATPARADDAEYALAYESKVNQLFEFSRGRNDSSADTFGRLKSQLTRDRDGALDIVGRLKTSWCKMDSDTAFETSRKALRAAYVGKPKTASALLEYQAIYTSLLIIKDIPCDPR